MPLESAAGAEFRFGLDLFLTGTARQLEELTGGRGEYQGETGPAARLA